MSDFTVGPYINFQGKAHEAMMFYHEVFGGDLVLLSADEHGAPKPAEPGERIMHARLTADGVLIVASDGHPKYPATVGEHMAIALNGTDKDRLTAIFSALADGGVVKGSFHKQPWGAEVGWLTDKFGMSWMVSIVGA